MNFKEEIRKLGWEEVPNPDKNNGWRQFNNKNGFSISFQDKSEEDILEDLKALTPDK